MTIIQGKPIKKVLHDILVPQPAVSEPETWQEYIRYG
jgi:hypothetical protein